MISIIYIYIYTHNIIRELRRVNIFYSLKNKMDVFLIYNVNCDGGPEAPNPCSTMTNNKKKI